MLVEITYQDGSKGSADIGTNGTVTFAWQVSSGPGLFETVTAGFALDGAQTIMLAVPPVVEAVPVVDVPAEAPVVVEPVPASPPAPADPGTPVPAESPQVVPGPSVPVSNTAPDGTDIVPAAEPAPTVDPAHDEAVLNAQAVVDIARSAPEGHDPAATLALVNEAVEDVCVALLNWPDSAELIKAHADLSELATVLGA